MVKFMEQVLKVGSLATLLLFSGNLSAEWGSENWGSMVWGQSTANVPLMGSFAQVIFFLLLLIIGLFASRRWGLVRSLPTLAVIAFLPLLVEADPIQLNIFQNGQVADAEDVNENFQAIANAISTNDCATASQLNVVETKIDNIQASGSCNQFDIAVYNQGKVDGANEVDITSDNQTLCQSSGGTYDSTQDACTVDITTDNAALCSNAGGNYLASTNTCTVDITTDNPNCAWDDYVWDGTSCTLAGSNETSSCSGVSYSCNGNGSASDILASIGFTNLTNPYNDPLFGNNSNLSDWVSQGGAVNTFCIDNGGDVSVAPGNLSTAENCGACFSALTSSTPAAEVVSDSQGIGICQDLNDCIADSSGQNACGTASMYSCSNNQFYAASCNVSICNSSCSDPNPFCIMDEQAQTQTCSTNRVVVKHQYANGWIWLQHEGGSKYLRGGLTQICGRNVSTMYAPNHTYGGVTQVNIGDSAGFNVGQNYPVNTDASAPGCP